MGRAARLPFPIARARAGRVPGRLGDVALAVVVGGYALAEVWAPAVTVGVGAPAGNRPVLTVTALAMALPLAFRRSYPLLVAGAVLGAVAVQSLATIPTAGLATVVAVGVVSYTVGALADRRAAVFGLGLVLAGNAPAAQDATDYVFAVLLFGGAWFAGRLVADWQLRAHAVSRAAQQLEAASDSRVREAVSGERDRIARELHDIVSHALSVVVVQAQAGQAWADAEPEHTARALRSIESTGREALVEMRRMVGVLRTDPAGGGTEPPPGLGRLDDLVDDLAVPGLEVSRTVTGQAVHLAPGVDLSAYRIVQEALTNVVRHAVHPGTRVHAHIALEWSPRTLRIEVTDDGAPGSAGRPADPGRGHGLIGMRERCTLYGGDFTAQRLPGGGFRVRATLPITPAAGTPARRDHAGRA